MSSLSIGIVGLPNVGKSTLFNALTKHSVPAENYPFCTIDPCIGVVPVPDYRLDGLTKLSKSEKAIPAVVEFVDIAGLVQGASVGEGLGNKFLSNIREVDAIAEVIRIFEDENIHHVHGEINPLSDIEVINLELIMADFQTVTARKGNLGKDLKKGDKKALLEEKVLGKVEEALDSGKLASSVDLNKEEKEIIKTLHLLTMKPILYVLNKKADAKNLDECNDSRYKELIKFFKDTNSSYVVVDVGIESDVKDLNEEEKNEYKMELLGVSDYEGGLDSLVKKGYEILDLITFLTTGEKESRAWTTKRGSTAPVAGTAIHGDFHDKFIRAEVVKYGDLVGVGSYAHAREKGLVRTEGKDYVVKDGDVVEFKI
ncbi:MAG TPA: redox-regulated ATPase YchF [Candidatus Paceibacterota bacterium]|nr:redox-regulated ATPase YchF [Candidatus Paceibacterota bacterium]HJN62964.1 redox-regulated ATPase YchF [Candidatus Paceibacterota bacterium]